MSGELNIFVRIATANLILSEEHIIQFPSKLNVTTPNNLSEKKSKDGEYLEFNISSTSISQEELIPELFASALMVIKLEKDEFNGIGTLIARNGERYKYLFNER